MVFWNLLDGGPSHYGPLLGPFESCEVVSRVLILIRSPWVLGK
jgi:hypothetical protein